jgi:hypothetical protein
LEAPLDAAIRQLNRNNDVAACNLLNAFLDQVDQRETNGQLTPQQAADLRQQATAIQDELGCSSSSSSSSSSPSSSISGVVGSIVNSTTIHDINPKGLMTAVNPNEIIHQPSSPSSLLPLPSLQSLP